jgi:hypothetical protein
MTVHLLKLCVGVESVDQLARYQVQRLEAMRKAGETPRLRHVTRNTPRRAEEVLDGGSLYWVIKGFVRVHQRIIGLEPVTTDEGQKCAIILDPNLVETEYQPRRPHQGWRYLEPADAPRDRKAGRGGLEEPSPEMLSELRELGLI